MTGTRFPLRVISTLAVLGILFAPAHTTAQVAVGTLLGNVTDESGAAIPGATITATETRTNISRTTTSNQAGAYTFTNTPPVSARLPVSYQRVPGWLRAAIASALGRWKRRSVDSGSLTVMQLALWHLGPMGSGLQ